MKIKTGDKVKILAGKDSGKTGEIMQVLKSKKNDQTYVVVKGLNARKKHLRAGRGQAGQVIELPGPIHISNVQLLDPALSKPSRVGYKVEGDKKRRVAKKTGEYID